MVEHMNLAEQHDREVSSGERFEFGKNWNAFLSVLDDERIAKSVESLQTMLGVSDLSGKTFLDIGSGSGLFSLAARRLGPRSILLISTATR
jgi:2-polyprenyl-6-hydroxyphenyl methylase/3-demethylubiquinone-9 3-methyltransferase